MTEVVRHYDKVDFKTTLDIPQYKTKLLEGLTILYRPQAPICRLRFCVLTPGRQLRPQEYIGGRAAGVPPSLSMHLALQAQPGGRHLAGSARGGLGSARRSAGRRGLRSDRRDSRSSQERAGSVDDAVIGVKGQLVVPEGPCGINAQVQFTFVPSEVTAPTALAPRDETTKEKAPGTTSQLHPAVASRGSSMPRATSARSPWRRRCPGRCPGNDGRLKGNIRRELVLERRIPAQAGGDARPSEVPNPDTRSHDCELVADLRRSPGDGSTSCTPRSCTWRRAYPDGGIDLLDRRPDGQDVIQVSLNAKTQDPQRDRLAADPIQAKKQLEDQWKQRGEKVVPGPSGWLPEADWSPLKRKVYRESRPHSFLRVTERPASGRIYLDHYIVQFTRNEVLIVAAMTTRDPHVQFRETAESIIKSFDFGPSEGSLPAAPTRVPDDSAHSRASDSAPR